jgi:hypothetical protein
MRGGAVGWILLGVALLAAASAFAVRHHRRGAAPAPIAAATLSLANGLFTIALAGAHTFVVVAVALGRASPVYDFRLYSLLLLGALLAGLGLALALAAAGVANRDRAGWRRAVWSAAFLVAVNAPLAPIQGFGTLLAALAAATLVLLVIARPQQTQGPNVE